MFVAVNIEVLNHCLQATPDFVVLLFSGLWSGVPEAKRSAMLRL